eukprot:COSAG01_NODE_40071_length_468_cov_0.718157_1_plen_98_part_01
MDPGAPFLRHNVCRSGARTGSTAGTQRTAAAAVGGVVDGVEGASAACETLRGVCAQVVTGGGGGDGTDGELRLRGEVELLHLKRASRTTSDGLRDLVG